MKIKGVSFSKYKVNVNLYEFEKLDLFEYIFIQVVLSSIDRNMKFIDCLSNLDIKEDMFYLFNNVYYKFIDNKIITYQASEDIEKLVLKDIVIDYRFIEYLKDGYFPNLVSSDDKEFIYDYLDKKVVLEKEKFSDSNVCVIGINNSLSDIEKIINENKKGLFNEDVGLCVLNSFNVDPYYFYINIDEGDKYISKNNKDTIYKCLTDNSLFISNEILKGDILTNNIYFSCLFGSEDIKDYCKYLFCFNKDKEFKVEDNIIYVSYDFGGDFIDLVSKEKYQCGKYLLENDNEVSTFNKEKINISEFKKYLAKNKDKFSININSVIDLF